MTATILSILPKRKGRQAVQDGRQVLRLFPRRRSGRTYVYAIAFDGDVIKVGQTGTPRARLTTHWKTANGEVKWVHLFESMHRETATLVERRLPEALAEFATQINGSEWFFGTDKAKLLRVVRSTIQKTKDEVRARWTVRDDERELVRAATKLLIDNGLVKTDKRP